MSSMSSFVGSMIRPSVHVKVLDRAGLPRDPPISAGPFPSIQRDADVAQDFGIENVVQPVFQVPHVGRGGNAGFHLAREFLKALAQLPEKYFAGIVKFSPLFPFESTLFDIHFGDGLA